MFTIFSHDGTLGGGKSSSSGAKKLTLGAVVPYVMGVGSGVYGVDSCTSYTSDSVIYLSW